MKVKDLLDQIEHCKKEYGGDFLEWEVYTEQITSADKKFKMKGPQKDWGNVKDSEGWEYFRCSGFWTKFEKERIFTINVNY